MAMTRGVRALVCGAVAALSVLSCTHAASPDAPVVMLYSGTGTSPHDVTALEEVLRDQHLAYVRVNDTQLQGMTKDRLLRFRLMIVPGGNFITMGNHFNAATTAMVHAAVQDGLHYLGVCAGAFLAGQASYTSFNLTSGLRFDFYAAARQGVRKAAVTITPAQGAPLDQYWEDGPQLAGWGAVVAKYPDGTPAVVEGRSGRGWVILTGIHAEAPEVWRRGMSFGTPASVDHAYAGTLITAALHGTMLPHF